MIMEARGQLAGNLSIRNRNGAITAKFYEFGHGANA